MSTVEEILRKTFEHLEEMLDEKNREKARADDFPADPRNVGCPEEARETTLRGRPREEH